MAKFHARPSLQYRCEYYGPLVQPFTSLSGHTDDDCADEKDSPGEFEFPSNSSRRSAGRRDRSAA
jgi:hypothetical protein